MPEDAMRALANQPPAGAGDYIPGKQVAVTPGKWCGATG